MNSKIYQTKIITDSNLMETISHGTVDYPFHFYDEHMAQFDFHCIEWHWHTEFEFVYVQTDSICVDIGSQQFNLQNGQGIFINSKLLHRFTSDADAIIPNFLFHPTFLAPKDHYLYQHFVLPILDSNLSYQIFSPEIQWQNQILMLMKELIKVQNLAEPELLSSSIVQRIWHYMYQELAPSILQEKSQALTSTQANLQQIMSYMHDHYMEEVSLDDIALHMHLSKSSIIALFKKYLHVSPINYLIAYRLNIAARLLLNSEKKLASIAIETGFHSVDYFCRVFKKHYELTPTQYRIKNGCNT